MIRAIFFDFDGVLVDSEPLHFGCWAEVLRRHGIVFSRQFYDENFIGVSNQAMVEALCREFGKTYSRPFFEDCYAKKKLLYRARALSDCQMPRELVAFIQAGSGEYRMGVVSSSSREEVEPQLAGQGIRNSIAALVCLEDVEKLKPFPDPYLRALELINRGTPQAIRPEECLVVEDSGPGEEAGRRAGMRVTRVRGPGAVVAVVQAELGRA